MSFKPRNFREWCNYTIPVLPQVYGDELSYYELLNKVIERCNEIGITVNELIDYVNHYFDSLDIQNIINAKLDEMAQDGTLESLICEAVKKDTGNYSNSYLTKQIVYSTAMSYFMNCWQTRNTKMSYGNAFGRNDGKGTALDSNVTDYSLLDCSTFVILTLLGCNYQDSPYVKKNVREGLLGFNRQFINTINNDTGLIRYAYEILMYGALNGYLYDYVSPEQIQTGDIVFFCWNDDYVNKQDENWWGKNTYKHCAHTGIAVSNCSKFRSRVGILHCVSTSALTDFSDLFEYAKKLENQHMYPKIMRPRLNVGTCFVNGFFRFRGDIDTLPLIIRKKGIIYAGGKMPTNMSNYFINKSDGTLSTDKSRYTTYLIPYNISMFVTNNVDSVGYNYCYYDKNEQYIGYSQNKWEQHDDCAFVRIEFFNRNTGNLTNKQMDEIQSKCLLTYHSWGDIEHGYQNINTDDIQYNDTIFYFADKTQLEGKVLISG